MLVNVTLGGWSVYLLDVERNKEMLGNTYKNPSPKTAYSRNFSLLSLCSLYTICIGNIKIKKSVTIENTALVYHASTKL
ncbi:MAG: hypothetical protein CL912_22305 [Deltaproteobacteria bacterium]|nr:hypothetical protein [Deltaproteobacteria bacterium]